MRSRHSTGLGCSIPTVSYPNAHLPSLLLFALLIYIGPSFTRPFEPSLLSPPRRLSYRLPHSNSVGLCGCWVSLSSTLLTSVVPCGESCPRYLVCTISPVNEHSSQRGYVGLLLVTVRDVSQSDVPHQSKPFYISPVTKVPC
ncbi:hypothetical protein IW261DRAFT_781009 [Armillaria novae-zelandiae]|uniref:Uncharacterized protein n=1 Tax=Armillaria novae-zelandiae TaxID=153914 RepID=A0AA39PLP1_9AGAR|nr:hypothetical protein IW261DRAFT_781009 [Armillaria novae-zelandiae]